MAQFTSEQTAVLKAHILADPVLSTKISGVGTDYAFVANAMNAQRTPAFWARKNPLYKSEVVSSPSADATTFNWPAYIARSQGERDGWRELWASNGGANGQASVDAGLSNVQQAFADIFSGSANNAPAQRSHLQAISRRTASVAEALLATGTGTTVSPAVFNWQGVIGLTEVGEIIA